MILWYYKSIDYCMRGIMISLVWPSRCNEQKLLLPSGLELMSESSESGALSLSSAARHIDFIRRTVFMSPS